MIRASYRKAFVRRCVKSIPLCLFRSERYALIAEDGKVTHLGVEAPGGFEASKAETILAAL